MPILWRYLIFYFLKIVIFCIFAFISILLTMRLDEIAHFAALGAPINYLLYFTLYQIPYILPIALPLSCLIASLLLVQRLSKTHELTAFRSSGFALLDIVAPLLLVAAFLSVGNFLITSEIATQSHLKTNLLKSELRSINPLLLLNNKHLMRLKGYYFEALGPSHIGESASDIVFAIANKHQQRLNLLFAQQLKAAPLAITGHSVTLISGLASDQPEDFDHLIIENMEKSVTRVQDFSNLLQKKVWTIYNDYLKMPFLLARIEELRLLLDQEKEKNVNKSQIKSLKNQLNRSYSEIVKRFSIACAVFSFTLMGTAFGINISRRRHYFSIIITIALAVLYLVAFFLAKGVDQNFMLSSILFIAPHGVIILASFLFLRRITKGIE